MKKPLSEMTLDELWQLFPIQLRAPNDDIYKKQFNAEAEFLRITIPVKLKINHIGSTAIGGIWAKPIVDILIEADSNSFIDIHKLLLENGYTCMSVKTSRRDYNKGYTEDGFADKVFHLHLRVFGDNDELYFRDYLAENKNVATEYEGLKLSLLERFEFNRDGYTDAKHEFVKKYTDLAKKEYGNKYRNNSNERKE